MNQPKNDAAEGEQKRVVVVLGMHRSGTSLLTSLLTELGVDLGDQLIPGDTNNEAGYWEQTEINRVQDSLLNHFRGPWTGPAWMIPFPLDWSHLNLEYRQQAKDELLQIVRHEVAKARGIWGFKDPRTTRLLPLWKEIFAELGLTPSYILALRHPSDVAASIVKRDKASASHGEMLWLLHNLDAVREAGPALRLITSYDRWFTQPLEQIRAITRALNLPNQLEEAKLLEAVKQRIRPDLRHWQTERAVTVPHVAEVFSILERAAELGGLPTELAAIDATVQQAFAHGEAWTNTVASTASVAPIANLPLNPEPSSTLARLVAFYLPQFHPIPENDRWWGKGFTEWTNVAQQSPRFPGHHQPRIPSELGFYDLRLPESRQEQANLARAHGLEAFCYWHYWFKGRRVLERPFNEILSSGQPDFGFCLAWANENWTRRWDGQNSEILLEQSYGGDEDDRAHFECLRPAFLDRRAFRIDGKPVFLIYRPAHLPDSRRTAALWQDLARQAGLPGLYLIALRTCFDAAETDWVKAGFNAELHFQPDFSEQMMKSANVLEQTRDRVVEYAEAWPVMSQSAEHHSTCESYHTVTPSWDNSARRKREAFIMHNSTPGEYGRWLRQEIARAQDRLRPHRVVFINAWNEWAEGNHLEPDLKWGRAYLEETLRANLGLPSVVEDNSTTKSLTETHETVPRPSAADDSLKTEEKPGHDVERSEAPTDCPESCANSSTTLASNVSADVAAPTMPGPTRLKASIIIPVLNKLDFTRKCLEALRQNTPTDLCEVIVWDNGSTDGTQAYFESLSPCQPPVKYYRSAENLGFVGGNNAAAEHAQGEYLILLNNDTEPRPGWLNALLQVAEANPAVGAVGAKLIYPNGQLQEAGGIIFNDASGWNYGRTDNPHDPRYNFPREVDYGSAACLLVRTELFRQLGGFDTRYAPAYYEDTDLCFALREAGHKVVYQPRCEIIHHEGATAGQDVNKGFKVHQVVNKGKFFDKWKKVLAQQPAPDARVVRRASNRATGQRILVVDPMMPMHDRASGSKRLFEMLKLLAGAGHAVTFVARNGANGERYAAELEELGVEVYAGDVDRMKECGYAVPGFRLDLQKLLTESKFDTVILSFWYIAEQYLPRIRAWSPTSRILIDTVDVHFVRERRQGELYGDKKMIAQAAETQRRELKIYSLADGLITVTEDDKKVLEKEIPGNRVFIVPNIHELSAEVPSRENRQGLLFVGGFAHLPNEDAVLYFHTEIWPLVQARIPGTRWTIVGNNPPPSVRALHGGLIEVTGYVPSTEPYLRSHLISIAPLRYGAGMKGKIGEALAHGLPVVTTSIGAEGMSLQSGDGGMLVATDPETFADHIVRLNTDRALWREQSDKGRQHTAANYTPQRIGERLGTLLEWSASFTSVIILARNQINDTRQCLESIEKYTRLPYELILVDNNSTDGTTDFFRQYAATRANVRVVLNRANLGFAGGNNQALSLARGDKILLLNNDTVVTAGWLERMVSALERHPDTGMVGPVSNNISGPQRVKTDYTTFTELPAFAEKWGQAHAGETTDAARLVGFCLMLKREVLEKIGGLDTCYGAGNFEDDDLCIRAHLAGYKMRIVWDSFVHHTGGQTFKGLKMDYNASLAKNWSIFKNKWAMAKEAPLEQGYRVPTALPAGMSIYVPLPNVGATHSVLMEGRCWAEGQLAMKLAGPGKTVRKGVTKIELPKVAQVGNLTGAREKLRQRKFAQAWEETLAALKLRPFHPEAHLLLAEIAQVAGDGASAQRCAKTARDLVPDWNPAQKFLNGSLRGKAQHPWLVLPPAVALRLSVCMIVKNEEEFLGRCLASVSGVASQIIVVDTGSTDRTVEIAKEYGAEVYSFEWCDDFAAARNAALQRATGDWILSIDADEELIAGEAEQLKKEMNNAAVLGFRIPIIDAGQEEDGCHYVPRLFRNAPGLFFLGRLHEQAFSSVEARAKEWGLRHDVGHTRLLHHGYAKELVKSRNKVERNLRLLEKAMAELPDEPNLVMNLGLELIHAGQREAGLRRYWEAVDLLGAKPDEEIVPELRETLLGQLTSYLIQGRDFPGILKLWETPLAKRGDMTASHHFGLGLALLETQQPKEAATHFSQCLAKRGQAAMSFINRDILKAGPHHCLALSLWGAQDKEGAAQAFLAALREDPSSRAVKYDFARLEAERGKPLEALKILNDMVQDNSADAAIWELGGRIALSRFEFLSFACDWTAEAAKVCPDHPSILRQRAEALFMAQDFERSRPLWIQAGAQGSPRGMAAVVLCEVLAGEGQRQFSTMDEALVCQEMLKWYRRLIAAGANSAVLQLHERMEIARKVVPSFVQTWEAASRRARETAVA